MLKLHRCKPFALAALAALAAPALLLADAAHAEYGATIVLSSSLGGRYTGRASVWSRHDELLIGQSDYLRVDWHGGIFQVGGAGVLPVDASGDTPRFGELRLTCWEPTGEPAGTQPPATTPAYSLRLSHQDLAWRVISEDGSSYARMLPRDGRTLYLQIQRTDDPNRRFQISQAALLLWVGVADGAVPYGAAMQRDLERD